ncbi:MAG: STAS domain-containing protein [Streptosporangiaceae bacterium]|nr:STAS domain-containing protein [Streptosporangiaceae bacterium]
MAGLLQVRIDRLGVVRVLALSGELDMTTVEQFAGHAAAALAEAAPPTRRLVVDLSGLRFVDCRGARVLAAVTAAVPRGCEVRVRSVRPAVRRVLGLATGELGRPVGEPVALLARDPVWLETAAAPRSMTGMLVMQSRDARAHAESAIADSRWLAGVVAATEDRLAETLAELAERRPARAPHLLRLVQDARRQATAIRGSADVRHGPGRQRRP